MNRRPTIFLIVLLLCAHFGAGARGAHAQEAKRTTRATARLTITPVMRIDSAGEPERRGAANGYIRYQSTVRIAANTAYILVAEANAPVVFDGRAPVLVRNAYGEFVQLRPGIGIPLARSAGRCGGCREVIASKVPRPAGAVPMFRLRLRPAENPRPAIRPGAIVEP